MFVFIRPLKVVITKNKQTNKTKERGRDKTDEESPSNEGPFSSWFNVKFLHIPQVHVGMKSLN